MAAPQPDFGPLGYPPTDTSTEPWRVWIRRMWSRRAYGGNVTVAGGAITARNLPAGWTVTYNAVGNYTLTHSFNIFQYGIAFTPQISNCTVNATNFATNVQVVFRIGGAATDTNFSFVFAFT